MSEVCTKCGLPKELCVCEAIAKESQTITISIEKKKFGKKYTIIQGIDDTQIDLKDMIKNLKNKFACGGTLRDDEFNTIELQGDHKHKVRAVLIGLGFSPETIKIR